MAKSPNSALTDSSVIRWSDVDLAYRLDVIAESIDDAVSAAGAWLFDRGKGGWKIRVFVAEVTNSIPLHILGVDTVALITELTSEDLHRATTLAIQCEVLSSNAMLAKRVYEPALRQGKEVVIWGEALEKLRPDFQAVCYARPSGAAVAFKARALAAGVGALRDTAPETFRRVARSPQRYPIDLWADHD